MGYYLQSVFAVSSRDKHQFFFYYIPGFTGRQPSFEDGWIDRWLRANFDRIAGAVSPNGVIIAPAAGYSEKFIEELFGGKSGSGFLDRFNHGAERLKLPEDAILHSFSPLLLVSKNPIRKRDTKSEGVIINLAGCNDETDLARIIDLLVRVVATGDFSLFEQLELRKPDRRLEESLQDSSWYDALKALELKPNVFGIGINLNHVLERVARHILDRVQKKQNPEP